MLKFIVISWFILEFFLNADMLLKSAPGLNLLPAPEFIINKEPVDTLACKKVDYQINLVLLRNTEQEIPFRNLDDGNFVCLTVGEAPVFSDRIADYLEMPVFSVLKEDIEEVISLLKTVEQYDRVIVGIEGNEISELYKQLIVSFLLDKEATVVFFGSAEDLEKWEGLLNAEVFLLSERKDSTSQDHAAQALFGGVALHGQLDHEIPGWFSEGHGIKTVGGLRFHYTHPDSLGLNGQRLNERIDSVITDAIAQQAFPGCQILMAVNGKIIHRKAYGHHTYRKRVRVQNLDLYDLASLTKISGPLPLLMQLYGRGVLELDEPFASYWPDWKSRLFHSSDKDTITLRQILAHQAGLIPYINFWQETKRKGEFKRRFYRSGPSENYSLEVDDHLYLKERFKKKMYRMIRKTDRLPDAKYLYSGLSFLIYPEMISELTGSDYETLLYNSIYWPSGARRLVYNPLSHGFSRFEIPPTEKDIYYRESQVHGRVHDEAASVLGGVSGNAGLFGNANDLAKLMQMYVNMGSYGGEQIIPRNVVEEFITVQYPDNDNRRGLGFDKPLPENRTKDPDEAYPARGVSQSSFGHSGFTGTFVWMDPEYEVVYIFLSNRVFPTRNNTKLYQLDVRTAVQQILYDELKSDI
jgi:CubicO group peptidase (beta-lactamase class C family)